MVAAGNPSSTGPMVPVVRRSRGLLRYSLRASRPKLEAMDRFWTPWRLRWYPAALVIAIALGFWVHIVTAEDVETLGGRLGGDFPAFYGAGTIVADGDVDQLYDLDRQFEAQRDLFPDGYSALYFAYPPYVAAGYRLLVPFGFTGAYVIFTALSLAALWGAVVLAEPLVAALRGRRLAAFAAALAFLPMAEGSLLGQNVAISLFLIVASWRLVAHGQLWAGGVVLGLLVYKPQLALPLAGLYLLSGRWRVTAGAAVSAIAAYAVSAALMGPGWIAEWLSEAGSFNELDVDVNGHLATSAVGFFANLGVEAVGWAMAVAVAGALAWLWWRRGSDLALVLAAACPGLILIAPHAQSYEPGLMLLTLAVFLDRRVPGTWWFWAAGLGKLAANAIGFNFTAVTVAVAFLIAMQLAGRRAEVAV